jgi:hypothetical protein
MAIGRSGMTKELFGNRTTKMKSGGVVAPGDGAKKTTSAALHTAKTPALKKGGKVQSSFMKMIAKKSASPKKMK